MEWKIKKFNELETSELYKILKERVDVFVVEQDCAYPEIDSKDQEAVHLYAEDDGKIAAYTRIISPGVSFEEGSLERVLVDIAYRGEGLGEELVRRGVEYVIGELHEKSVKIMVKENLLEFFMSLGFQPVSEAHLYEGIFYVDMIYNKI